MNCESTNKQLTALEALALFDPNQAAEALSNIDRHFNHSVRPLLTAINHQGRVGQRAVEGGARSVHVRSRCCEGNHGHARDRTTKPAYILARGEYNQRGGEVPPGVPEWLLPLPNNSPRKSAGIAQWLTDPNHPLTSRVAVNRVWQSLFGRGMVRQPKTSAAKVHDLSTRSDRLAGPSIHSSRLGHEGPRQDDCHERNLPPKQRR